MIFFDFQAPLFWYKLVFFTELILAETLATYSLKKREKFALRAVLSVLGGYLIVFLLPLSSAGTVVNSIYSTFLFLFMFALSLGILCLCFDEKISTLFFCGVLAYTVQHISYSTYDYVVAMTEVGSYNIYGNINVVMETNVLLMVLIYIAVYGLIYWAVWAFLEHKMREQEKLRIEPLLVVSFAAILFVDIVVSNVVNYLLSDLDKITKTVIYLYRLSSCVFIFIVLYSNLQKHQAEYETAKIELLWSEDKKRYELTKKNIEAINIKCHDLKHQIRNLRSLNGGVIDEEYLKEMEKNISIYDNSVHTGNEALDLILTETSMNMAREDISFSVIADGSLISFMSHSDVYSLFGNAVSNAMEAVEKFDDKEKRLISLHIYQEGKMIVIHIENPCQEVTFDASGLPVTSKENKEEHGYGMHSMKLICEKYSGVLSTSQEDGFFFLDMLFPKNA